MKLVDDARNWWKWHSTHFLAVLTILLDVWLRSPDLQAMLPPIVLAEIAPAFAVLGFLLRIRDQAKRAPPPRPTVPTDQRLPPA